MRDLGYVLLLFYMYLTNLEKLMNLLYTVLDTLPLDVHF